VAAVLRLCEVESQALEARMDMSPELGSTLMWFLAHWAQPYLLSSENTYSDVSTATANKRLKQ
jgi:hypothetical protein